MIQTNPRKLPPSEAYCEAQSVKLRTFNAAKQGYNEFDANYEDVLENLRNTKVVFITRKLYGPPVDGEDDDDDGSIIEKQSVVPSPEPLKQTPEPQTKPASTPAENDKSKTAAPAQPIAGNTAPGKPPVNPATVQMTTTPKPSKPNEDLDKQGVQRIATNPKWIGPSEDEVPVIPGVKGPKKRLTQVPRHNAGVDEP